jgi:hypothetical protein
MTLKIMLAISGTAAAIALVPLLVAQEAASNFDRWWRPELEAVTAAPLNHKVLFENDEVRVLEVTIAPHTQEPLHVHRWPAVIYIDKSAHLVEHLQDGKVEDRGNRPDGTLRWLPIDQGHFLENVDSKPLHAIRVELKKAR